MHNIVRTVLETLRAKYIMKHLICGSDSLEVIASINDETKPSPLAVLIYLQYNYEIQEFSKKLL